MTDEAALLAGVLARPDDDLPRLVLADWLDENGKSDRAEFIRAQCHAPDANAFRLYVSNVYGHEFREGPPYATLWGREPLSDDLPARAAFFADWCRWPVGARLMYRRGFVEAVACPAADWVEHGDTVLAAHPVTEVRLTTQPEWEPLGPGAGCCVAGDPERRAFTSRDHEAAFPAGGLDEPGRWGGLASRLLRLRWPSVRTWHLPPGPLPVVLAAIAAAMELPADFAGTPGGNRTGAGAPTSPGPGG